MCIFPSLERKKAGCSFMQRTCKFPLSPEKPRVQNMTEIFANTNTTPFWADQAPLFLCFNLLKAHHCVTIFLLREIACAPNGRGISTCHGNIVYTYFLTKRSPMNRPMLCNDDESLAMCKPALKIRISQTAISSLKSKHSTSFKKSLYLHLFPLQYCFPLKLMKI